MQNLLFVSILTFSLSCFGTNKAKNQTQRQPAKLAVSFESFGKNKVLLNTISFDGAQKALLTGDVKNVTDFKCESSGQFELITVGITQYIAAFLDFTCSSNTGQNEPKSTSKIGRLLIPVKDYQSFFKIIFLHKDQPEVVLKIKELSL